MTPTEQDKELRAELQKINSLTESYAELEDRLVDFITADRKRVALEARLDELEHLDDQSIGTDWKANAWFSVSDRMDELKAQQEEV